MLLLPFRRNDAPAAQRHRPVASDATLVFHIPLPARPLIRAARTFLLGRNPDLWQRVFAGITPIHERIAETAERCGVRLPAQPPYLIDAWLLCVTWTHLDIGVHTNPPGHIGPGRSCLTATPADTMLVPRPTLHRHPDDHLRNRWSPRNVPTFLPGLVRAYLDGTEPNLRGYREHHITVPAGGDTIARRRRDLVEQHLAVRTTPAGPATPADGITVHPDIPFALRLSHRPAPPEPVSRAGARATTSNSVTAAAPDLTWRIAAHGLRRRALAMMSLQPDAVAAALQPRPDPSMSDQDTRTVPHP